MLNYIKYILYLFFSVFRTVYKLEIGYSWVNFIKRIYGNKSSLVELSLVSCSNFSIVALFWLVTLMYSHCMCRVYGTCVTLLCFVLAVVVPRLSVARGLCRGSRFDSRWGQTQSKEDMAQSTERYFWCDQYGEANHGDAKFTPNVPL